MILIWYASFVDVFLSLTVLKVWPLLKLQDSVLDDSTLNV